LFPFRGGMDEINIIGLYPENNVRESEKQLT
jgi:hypothetical protein